MAIADLVGGMVSEPLGVGALVGERAAEPGDVLALAERHGARMVDLKFTDLPGTWQHMGMALASLDEEALADGIGFDGSSIRGFQEIYESDMLLLPDPSTAVVDPFYEASTLSLVCTVLDPITREPYTRDPRYVAMGRRPSAERRATRHLPYLSRLDLSSFEGSDPPAHHSLNIPYVVTVLARNAREAFGPDVGEIVVRDVRPSSWQPRPAYSFTGWGRLSRMIDDGEFDMSLRATARRVADDHGVR